MNNLPLSILVALLLVSSCFDLKAEQLSPSKRQNLETQALAGSGIAARQVALFYGTNDDDLMEYWSWIGAENGDPLCQYNYASILHSKADSYSQKRAIYWMRKAAAQNDEYAKERLRELEEAEKR